MKACPFNDQLDHDLYEHRRSLVSPAKAWPDGHHVAAFILIRLQSLEIEPPIEAIRDPRWNTELGTYSPAYRAHSLMEYGNRFGIFRLLDLLQPLGWRIAISVNGLIAHQNPWLIKQLQQRDVQLVASGWSASRMISNALDESTERAWLTQTLHALGDATGERPRVYASQDYGYSTRSAALLTSAGIDVTVDWPNDEKPFFFGPNREIVNIPVLSEIEDSQMMINRKLQTPAWVRQLSGAIQSWPEMASPGSVMALPLHAWISAVPHRFTLLREAMLTLNAGDFWQASPSQIAHYWKLNP